MLFYRNVFCKIYNRENIVEFFFDKNQMICKDLTNCHPNDNRKRWKIIQNFNKTVTRRRVQLNILQSERFDSKHATWHPTQPKSSWWSSIYAKFGGKLSNIEIIMKQRFQLGGKFFAIQRALGSKVDDEGGQEEERGEESFRSLIVSF